MIGDQINLTLPAKPEYILTIRMVVSTIAARLDFDIDTIEDLKAGAAEACILFLNAALVPDLFDITITIGKDFMVEVKGQGEQEAKYDADSTEDIEMLAKCLIEEFYDHAAFDYDNGNLKMVTISKHVAV